MKFLARCYGNKNITSKKYKKCLLYQSFHHLQTNSSPIRIKKVFDSNVMIKAFALMLSAASMVIASNATNLAKKDVLFAWSPWSECQEGKRERSSFQKIKEVENCYGQGSDSQKSAQCKFDEDEIQDCNCDCKILSDGDCYELYQAGYTKPDVYTIEIRTGVTAKVKCSEWGWTVIQSRGQFGNPVDYFDRDWKTYQEGFGTPGKY